MALLALSEVKERGDMRIVPVEAGRGMIHNYQFFRMRIRQRIEEDAMDHAEDAGVGPDADRQGADGHESEQGRFGQTAENVPQAHR